jgi:hypothetical protein
MIGNGRPRRQDRAAKPGAMAAQPRLADIAADRG